MEEAKKPFYRYCIVPKCKNTIRTTPDKVFFAVPRDEHIRKQWCKVMRRGMVSSTSCLHCCEDHFNVEEDTSNYIKYKLMKQQGKKVTLLLKKGVVPHIFKCQKRNISPPVKRMGAIKRQRLALVNEALTEVSVKESSEIYEPPQAGLSTSYTEVSDYQVMPSTSHNQTPQAGPSTSYTEVSDYQVMPSTSHNQTPQAGPSTSYTEVSDYQVMPSTSHNQTPQAGPSTSYTEVSGYQTMPYTSNINSPQTPQAGPRTSYTDISNNQVMRKDKSVQVNIKMSYRSKGVNVNLKIDKSNVALSPLSLSTKNMATSPIKSIPKKKLFAENPVDVTSISSISSVVSHDYEPSTSSDVSWVQDDSDEEKQFKNTMRSGMLVALEKEPKMLLGIPKNSYHLIKLLSENIPLPTIDILITLKKIKLNDSFSILALHFGYTQSTVSRIFSKSVPLIAAKMKDLIVWPTLQEIYKELPIPFRARYANVISIIDCLEIQIEKPSDAVHQSLTWSQYKKCNTLKYLISCTPDGLINFISDGYGGRATDVIIVQDCGYLECLPSNKAVMADRGFKDLSCMLEAKKCTLIRPPSVSKNTPSTKDEVKQSKRIAALRIHVERVIGRLREFHMLLPHACVDHNLIPVIDEVITIACGLVNIQDVLIKK